MHDCRFFLLCLCISNGVCAGAMWLLPLAINQPTHLSRLTNPQSRSFSHSHTQLIGLSCGSLWGLSLSCRVYSIDASSHRFRPSDHMCVNERSVVATISGGNSQWWQQSVVAAVSAETTCWRPLLYLGIAIVVLHGCSLTVMICCAVFAGLASC